jgi:hypothetical protein
MFIIAEKANQLANRLFLFAHLLACAREHRVKLVNTGFEEYAEHFQTTRRDLFCRYPPRPSLLPTNRAARERLGVITRRMATLLATGKMRRFAGARVEVLCSGYDTTLVDSGGEVNLQSDSFLRMLQRAQVIFFLGPLFRDFTNFRRHADAIRDYFKPLDAYEQNVAALILRARADNELLVGVHIRQGDYARFVGGKYLYTIEEYCALMRRTQALFAQPARFLVCSNSSLRTDEFPNLRITLGTGHLIEDLYALARCDYLIGPPSTYSLWASFYGQVPLYTINDVHMPPALSDFSVNCG